MYVIFTRIHGGLSALALLATLTWAVLVLARAADAARPRRPVYIGTMAVTGLAGLSGLIVMVWGGFTTQLFPWLGLLAVAAHGVAGVRSRKAVAGGRTGVAVGAVLIQIAVLLGAFAVMPTRPF